MIQIVNPLYLSGFWDHIKPGLTQILEDMNSEVINEMWIPEDVYASIKSGESQLWIGDEGFVVSIIHLDRYNGEKTFTVWLGYSFDNTNNVLENNQKILEEYARNNQCHLMKFYSTRKGFLRRAKDLGYSVGPVTFVKRI